MARNLFETPADEWEYADADAFLQARVAENDTVEYKGNNSENIVDTLVAFANGDSPGLVFVGVSEVSARKVPNSWPELPPGKDHLSPVYSKAAAETIPLVEVEARQLEDPRSGKQIVVVRVEPGPQPPYFGKGRGVKVRSGDQDVDADPRTLEALFARRQDSRLIRVAQQADLYALLRLFSGTGGAPILAVRFAPALPAERVPFNPRLSSAIRNLVANEVWAVEHGTEQRYDEGVRYVGQNGTTILVVKHDGAVEFAQSLSEPRDQKVPIPLLDIAISCGTVLKLARRAHVELLGGRGAFYAGVGLSLIAGRQLAWPQNVPHTLEPTRVDAASTDTWTHDTADFRLSDSPRAFVADAIKALAYRWGYNHHADYIDTWGIVNEV